MKTRILASLLLVLLISILAASPLSAYVLQTILAPDNTTLLNIRWDPAAFPLPWSLNATAGSNVSGSVAFATMVQQCFQNWAGISSAKITFAQGANTTTALPGYDGVNEITTNLTAAQWAALGGGSSVLAFTITSAYNIGASDGSIVDNLNRAVKFPGQILEADIVFNPAFNFSTSNPTPAGSTDLESVLTHEVGHFLGLDHTNMMSSTMFWTTQAGQNYQRALSSDETAGISSLYPAASFSALGTLSGTVRTTSNAAVFGAVVVVMNASGQPVASTITDVNGQYSVAGLASGSYTVYAEPLDGPVLPSNIYSLSNGRIQPGGALNTTFNTRFH